MGPANVFNPLELAEISGPAFGEPPSMFLERTLLTGSDISAITHDLITNYASDQHEYEPADIGEQNGLPASRRWTFRLVPLEASLVEWAASPTVPAYNLAPSFMPGQVGENGPMSFTDLMRSLGYSRDGNNAAATPLGSTWVRGKCCSAV